MMFSTHRCRFDQVRWLASTYSPHDQLQLTSHRTFPFYHVAASDVACVRQYRTGEIVGGIGPLLRAWCRRTTVDLFGNVWTATGRASPLMGTVRIGCQDRLIVGGTRVVDRFCNPTEVISLHPLATTPVSIEMGRSHPNIKGSYDFWLASVTTARRSGWCCPGAIDDVSLFINACLAHARHVSVDATYVWVGGYPYASARFTAEGDMV